MTRKVGEILLDAGVIDELQLKAALAEQDQWGRRLGITLIKMGMVEEAHLIRALAEQLGIPATSLVGKRIAPEVIALVPARIASDQAVIPLFVKGAGKSGTLFLGMEDPSKLEVLDDLCFRTGLQIQPVMVGPTELSQAIDRYYSRDQAGGGTSASVPLDQEVLISESRLALGDDISSPDALPPEPSDQTDRTLETSATRSRRAKPTNGASKVETIEGLIPEDHGLNLSIDELTLTDLAPVVPDGLLENVDRAVGETERTRVVLKALTQLLVEKKLVALPELQVRIARIKDSNSSD